MRNVVLFLIFGLIVLMCCKPSTKNSITVSEIDTVSTVLYDTVDYDTLRKRLLLDSTYIQIPNVVNTAVKALFYKVGSMQDTFYYAVDKKDSIYLWAIAKKGGVYLINDIE